MKKTIAFADLTASHMLGHNLFINFKATIRRSSSVATPFNYDNNSTITSGSLR
jgi:hypothetical protein